MSNRHNTRRFPVNKSRTYNHDRQKKIRNILVAILIAILMIGLLVAIVFVAKDLFSDQGGDDTSATPAGEHNSSDAYDSDPDSYYLSNVKQSAGVYFEIALGNETAISALTLDSSHPEHYIRSAVLQISADHKTWETVGSFAGPASKTATLDAPVFAKYARVVITADHDAFWAINTISVTDSFGEPATVASASAGKTSGFMSDDTIGGATDDNTTGEVTTEKPAAGYTNIAVNASDIYMGALILVNNQHEYRFPSSEADILTLYDEVKAQGIVSLEQMGGTRLKRDTMYALFAMCNALHAETGLDNILIGDGYRDYATQQDLSTKYPATAAVPGYSEHHTALAVDLKIWDALNSSTYTFEGTHATCSTIRTWVESNAWKYGFIRRFAPDKDALTGITNDRWHYRYVGVPHAYYMKMNNLCLEEYIGLLESNYRYGKTHLQFTDDLGKKYEVYFVPASLDSTTAVPVSDTYSYTISGNNYSGFIVTNYLD